MVAEPDHLFQALDRDLSAIAPVAEAMRNYAAGMLGMDGATSVELSLVEALTNAIKHGSLNGRATGQIVVKGHANGRAMVVEVFDSVPVVPEGLLERAGAHRLEINPEDIDTLAENGRGLSIIVLCMDEVTLSTTKDKYILRMVKYPET